MDHRKSSHLDELLQSEGYKRSVKLETEWRENERERRMMLLDVYDMECDTIIIEQGKTKEYYLSKMTQIRKILERIEAIEMGCYERILYQVIEKKRDVFNHCYDKLIMVKTYL